MLYSLVAAMSLFGMDYPTVPVQREVSTVVYQSSLRQDRIVSYCPEEGGHFVNYVFAHGWVPPSSGYGSDSYVELAEFLAARGVCVYLPEFDDAETFSFGNQSERHGEMGDVIASIEGEVPIVVGGHSFGSDTALYQVNGIYVAQVNDEPPTCQWWKFWCKLQWHEYQNTNNDNVSVDTRIKAVTLMSPQGTSNENQKSQWLEVEVPTLTMTGTADTARAGHWTTRTEPHYAFLMKSYLSVLHDGTHSFGNLVGNSPEEADTRMADLTKSQIFAIIRYYAAEDEEAFEWLNFRYAGLTEDFYMYNVRN